MVFPFKSMYFRCTVSQLKVSLKWKLVGTVNGNAELTLPASWKELQVITSSGGLNLSWRLIVEQMSTEKRQFATGYYYTNTSYGGYGLFVSYTKLSLEYAVQVGKDVVGNAVTTVYYK